MHRIEGEAPDLVLRTAARRAAGDAVCHLAVSPDGAHLIATCWGDGRVALYALDSAGTPGAPSYAAPAEDPHTLVRGSLPRPAGLPSGSRAHMALWLGNDSVATADIGYDTIRFFRVDRGRLDEESSVPLPAGSGPRHIARVGDALVVCTEHSGEVFSVVLGVEGARIVDRIDLRASGRGDAGSAAHIEASGEGLLHVGVRGTDVMVVLRCDSTGRLHRVGEFDSGGLVPRHHLVRNGSLHIAHQGSDEITTHQLDGSGLSLGVVGRTRVGSPSVIVAG